MDQTKDLFSLESNGVNEVIAPLKNEKKKVARRRWGILAKALKVFQFGMHAFRLFLFFN